MAIKAPRIDYPRAGREGWRRFVPSGKQTLGGIGALILLGILVLALSYAFVRVPEPNEFARSQTTVVY